jgi:putative ABC transport system substrate-binding protein
MFRRAAEMIDTILHGTKPAEIAVEQQTQFEPVFNAITARALGLTIPETLLATTSSTVKLALAVRFAPGRLRLA